MVMKWVTNEIGSCHSVYIGMKHHRKKRYNSFYKTKFDLIRCNIYVSYNFKCSFVIAATIWPIIIVKCNDLLPQYDTTSLKMRRQEISWKIKFKESHKNCKRFNFIWIFCCNFLASKFTLFQRSTEQFAIVLRAKGEFMTLRFNNLFQPIYLLYVICYINCTI